MSEHPNLKEDIHSRKLKPNISFAVRSEREKAGKTLSASFSHGVEATFLAIGLFIRLVDCCANYILVISPGSGAQMMLQRLCFLGKQGMSGEIVGLLILTDLVLKARKSNKLGLSSMAMKITQSVRIT